MTGAGLKIVVKQTIISSDGKFELLVKKTVNSVIVVKTTLKQLMLFV